MKSLSGRGSSSGRGLPVPISDSVTINGINEYYDKFLNWLQNKLRGDIAQFTSEIHQISYAVCHLTREGFESIRAPTPRTLQSPSWPKLSKQRSEIQTPRKLPTCYSPHSTTGIRTCPTTWPTSPISSITWIWLENPRSRHSPLTCNMNSRKRFGLRMNPLVCQPILIFSEGQTTKWTPTRHRPATAAPVSPRHTPSLLLHDPPFRSSMPLPLQKEWFPSTCQPATTRFPNKKRTRRYGKGEGSTAEG